ncbi:hypothetical protein KC332_g11500 [Hortaea werneckii]|nr:hypothetical protein KC358_g13541 [Hortaea werneckii]KAI6808789.1 hypothetical protein KC350_g13192 [Hortaea werneckii]KAI6916074.1 hypothetical protein KC348_g11724 [Hortaea werneckii]KAI6928983.1 hypothetical protein KC341_g11160 [Hortaea werneckii]KAI6958801.1 hypothetical protein KC321_g13803 [Hortaea werneckii]
MPSFTSFLTVSLLAVGTLAQPAAKREKRHRNNEYCLSNREAQQVATNYGLLISNYSDELANAVLSPDFTDYSESVNTLINSCPQGSAAISLPLLAPTFSNRTQFEIGQGQQPLINFNQLNIWHSCDTVIIRWETTNTANITDVKPVVGLISMETVKAPSNNEYEYWVDTVYSEFDAGAWLQNLQEAGICSGNVIADLKLLRSRADLSILLPPYSMAPKRKQPAATPAPKAAPKRRSKLAKENDLTAEEEAEIQEAYNLFAHESDEGLILDHADVRRCLIALNAPPTDQAEMKEILDTIDPDDAGYVDYEHFVAVAALKLHSRHDDPGAQDEEVMKAYSLFTKGEERDITLHDLRRIVKELREDIPDNVLKDMVREATGGGLGAIGTGDFESVMRRAGVFN